MTRPTILQIVPELDTGGAELSAIEVAGAIARAGGRALVLSEGGRLVARLETAGGEFVPFAAASKNPVRILWNAASIARLIARESVDLVHARSRAPAWSALLAARRMKTPFVTTVHGAHSESNRIKRLYNSVMARGDLVITNSAFTDAIVRARYGVPEERSRVIYRGIDPDILDPSRVSAERVDDLRRAWNVDADARIILLAARLSPIKGHRVVIAAMQMLKERGELGNVVAVLAGDAQGRDGYVAELLQVIEAAGLQQYVRLPGHVADIPAALMAAHVAVVASTVPETFGRTVAEAAAMECPMIAPHLGAPPELMVACPPAPVGAATGWLVPAGDVAGLADALARALTLPAVERKAMGQRARAFILSRFTLDAMRQRTLAVYDELLGTRLVDGYTRSGHPQ